MKLYGLVGHPLGHSFSKAYFTEKFRREGLDSGYLNLDLQDVSQVREAARQAHLDGFNVTTPYKESILPYLDALDPIAATVGAANTVLRLPDGQLKGFNTDVVGFAQSIQHIHPKPTLILGTGGASKAVQYVLRANGIPFHTTSRDAQKGHFTYRDLTPETIQAHPLIVNATPLGMFPNIDEAPEIHYEAITSQHTLIDLIYNPEETLFLRYGRERGAQIINGLNMLHAQAEASWKLWQHPEKQ